MFEDENLAAVKVDCVDIQLNHQWVSAERVAFFSFTSLKHRVEFIKEFHTTVGNNFSLQTCM